MTKKTLTAGKTIVIEVPEEYVGKEVEVLIFTNDELPLTDNGAVLVPDWQKIAVEESIARYQAHPELLIAEEDAWKILNV